MSSSKCACGAIITTQKRYEHWRQCEAMREKCADDLRRIFNGKPSSVEAWRKQHSVDTPGVQSARQCFGGWTEFVLWAGVGTEYIGNVCVCGYATNSVKLIAQHQAQCNEWRARMVDELERIAQELGTVPTQQDWNDYRKEGYPHHETPRRAWETWVAFQDELLRRERIDAEEQRRRNKAQQCEYGLTVSSVRIVGNKAYMMLR